MDDLIQKQLDSLIPEWCDLIKALIPEIQDDYRATDDSDDNVPGMQLTIATNDKADSWGFQTGDNSFMGKLAGSGFDRVLMNPPFEKGQDAEHVMRAHALLAPGGWLIAIMSPGPFFRSDAKAVDFRDWFASRRGAKMDLPADSFKESGTGVASVMVAIKA